MRRINGMVAGVVAGVLMLASRAWGGAPDPVPSTSPNGRSPSADAVSLDALTYNTWGLPAPLGTRTRERYQRLSGALGRHDWVTLQEAFTNEANRLLGLPSYPFTFWESDRALFRFNSGLMTLSPHPIVAREFVPFDGCAHADCLSHKGVMWTRLQVTPSLQVDVYNTHYQAEDDAEAIRVQRDNPTLQAFIQRHETGNPTFVQGDFNFIEGRVAYTDLVHRLPLQDLWRAFRPDEPGYSYDSRLNPYLAGLDPRQRLDYLFFLKNDRYDVQVDDIRLVNRVPVDGMVISDHFGVHMRVKLVPMGTKAKLSG